jgi:molybdopterin-containing oxidoreductase family iron-sulfur binding subunit
MKKYWRSLEEVVSGPVIPEEEKSTESSDKGNILSMIDGIPFKQGASRRDFIKLMSYSVASSAILAACKKPIQYAVPFLTQPTDVVPGVASHYASTFYDGSEYCPIVVKVRDGRPIKLEGNSLYPYTRGGTSPRVQASVLSLYDNARIQGPQKGKTPTTWSEADREITAFLQKLSKEGKEIIVLTPTIFSPSTHKILDEFRDRYPTARVVYYDGVSYSGLADAHRETTGEAGIPYPLFGNAELILSFGADFLGTWLLPTEFTLAYVQKRKVEKGAANMSRHIQFESGMSLTGSNADERVQMKPSQEGIILASLHNLIASKTSGETIDVPELSGDFKLEKFAGELLSKRGKSIVISGSNDSNIQKIVIAINRLLGNYGHTFDTTRPILTKQGSDKEFSELIQRIESGTIGAILFNQVNPCYDYYNSKGLISALEKVELKISFASFPDETMAYCDYVIPDSHFLESWNDFEPRKGIYSISQPCIHPIFDTRQLQDSLLTWSGSAVKFTDYLTQFWQNKFFPRQNQYSDFNEFRISLLQKGCIEFDVTEKTVAFTADISKVEISVPDENNFELQLTVPVAIASPFHSNNPWLQELPDPISRVTWDNYASISTRFAEEKGITTGDIIVVNGMEIPALVQPGQAYRVISIALNYGRTAAGKVAADIGIDVYPLAIFQNNNIQYYRSVDEPVTTPKKTQLAQTQTHHTLDGREIVRETTLKEYKEKADAGNEIHKEFEKHHQTLYPEHRYDSFRWGLGVDLNSCIGCGTCTIACQAENNVAVVGKEQVIKRRIMHWIRIDRYYTGEPERPSVLFQPMMCQHCDNAPCENVCPVAATTHSNEGLNQMAYNRCVGTRYCINNCPYKVRRFNWFKFTENPKFDYNQNSELGKLVLNPDVVVRERGVVEKCSFCVQRIQEKKLNAKLENRTLKDGEVVPACVQACPAEALTFGDLNDAHSNIFKMYSNERNYHVLEELHTLPKVGYLTKVRNTEA